MGEPRPENHCEVCGTRIEDEADVCSQHAMTDAQLVEMWRRMNEARFAYLREIWGG